ncbi:hypothetical protein [Streptomyces sp. H39-S7]|uniref:hypothetical protein n=1 Tax=Streptomyces sp. H39-S7 TaxID=3004357 RepID=UPI0022AFBE46|nr:hypothetical protein [Streptomyces sp. H39-S7]MCZ4121372.1 hypothetical protein [Streptomyces sp. H39-S7]
MNTESNHACIFHPWLPVSGHRLRKVGVFFDAVRVGQEVGEKLAARLEALTDGEPGPVIAQSSAGWWMYFLVAAGSSAGRSWPPGITRLGSGGRDAYVGIPALTGLTWPLSWRCAPRQDRRLVDADLLHGTLCAQLGWEPRPFERG